MYATRIVIALFCAAAGVRNSGIVAAAPNSAMAPRRSTGRQERLFIPHHSMKASRAILAAAGATYVEQRRERTDHARRARDARRLAAPALLVSGTEGECARTRRSP